MSDDENHKPYDNDNFDDDLEQPAKPFLGNDEVSPFSQDREPNMIINDDDDDGYDDDDDDGNDNDDDECVFQ